mmetsp:Transcript_77815/g.202746  ORF Transcript_77815/g.202746 Transcript_77815/m.202746 type:complete len:264 (-) Transcript_77815:515-1306(-)
MIHRARSRCRAGAPARNQGPADLTARRPPPTQLPKSRRKVVYPSSSPDTRTAQAALRSTTNLPRCPGTWSSRPPAAAAASEAARAPPPARSASPPSAARRRPPPTRQPLPRWPPLPPCPRTPSMSSGKPRPGPRPRRCAPARARATGTRSPAVAPSERTTPPTRPLAVPRALASSRQQRRCLPWRPRGAGDARPWAPFGSCRRPSRSGQPGPSVPGTPAAWPRRTGPGSVCGSSWRRRPSRGMPSRPLRSPGRGSCGQPAGPS